MTATTAQTIVIYTAVAVFHDTLRGPSVKTSTSQFEVAQWTLAQRRRDDVEAVTMHTTAVNV